MVQLWWWPKARKKGYHYPRHPLNSLFKSVMSVQKSLLAFTFPSATVQMGNVIRLYVKDHSPNVIHISLPNKEHHHKFQQTKQAKKGKGYWCFTFNGTAQRTAISLSALHTDLTYPWATWFQGLATKHRHVHLPWGFGEGPLSSQSTDLYLSSTGLLWKIPFRPCLFFR